MGGTTRVVALTLAALIAGIASDSSAEASEERPRVRSVVPGEVVALKGRLGKGTRVKVDGRKVKVVSSSGREVRFVVPDVRPGIHRAVARGRGVARARLRVGNLFEGEVETTLDGEHAAAGSIGAAGGSVTATGSDGTVYELRVPAGALSGPTSITLTPIAGIEGLPFARARRVGVGFAPDGLTFKVPAELLITPAGGPADHAGAFIFDGTGNGLELVPLTTTGGKLRVAIEHFSGAGSGTLTPADFVTAVGRFLLGRVSVVQMAYILETIRTFERLFGDDFCLTDVTCRALEDEVYGHAVDQAEQECGPVSEVGVEPTLDCLRDLLEIEANAALLFKPMPERDLRRLRAIRLDRTRELITAAVGPTETDVLAKSAVDSELSARHLTQANLAGTGPEVSNGEWVVFLAGLASQQGFPDLQGQALTAAQNGLDKVLDHGKEVCETSITAGRKVLNDGIDGLARPTQILAVEFSAALDECVYKVKVLPNPGTVQIGGTLQMSATSNEEPPPSTFTWSVPKGSIDSNGNFTAPTVPGPVIVTATSTKDPAVDGTATVDVKCPAGQVPFAGQCQTIGISVSPTAVTLQPGGSQQFTATVANTIDTRVTWSKSCGAITQAGFYTAPSTGAATCTITAVSVADPTKAATAAVTVAGDRVDLTSRSSEFDLTSRAVCTSPSGFETVNREGPGGSDFSGPLHLEATTSASAGCSTTGTESQDSNLHASSAGGTFLTFSDDFTGSAGGDPDDPKASTNSVSAMTADLEAIGSPATVTCTGSLTNGLVGINIDDDRLALASESGSLSGSVTIPADGDEHHLFIGVNHGVSARGGSPGSSSITCTLDQPSVVVPH